MKTFLQTESPLLASTQLRPFRRADYDAVPEEGGLCELISGWIYRRPKLSVLYQIVLGQLALALSPLADEMGAAPFIGPLDVHLSDHTILQPDLLLISAERRHIVQAWILGAPDLVVEILTPGHERRDRVHKLPLYAEAGVLEVWLVNPEEKHIDFYANENGRLATYPRRTPIYSSRALQGVSLDLAAL